MGNIPRMSRTARRRLVRAGRRSGDPRVAVRFHVVAELAAGQSRNAVARLLHVAVSTVVRIARQYLALGVAGLFDQRSGNGPSKIDDRFTSELRNVLQFAPTHYGWTRSTWTRELLAEEMMRREFPRVAVCTMGRALRALGVRRGRPKPIVLCPWPTRKREMRLKALRELAASSSADEPVYYADEVDIDFNPRIGCDWMLPGHQRLLVTPGQNQKHYVAGALHAKTRRLVWVEHPRKNSTLFCKLLSKLLSAHRRATYINVILDNYSIHKSNLTKRILRALGGRVRLHFLPPYCPDDNPIERVWLALHSFVTRNHRCSSFPELAGRVAEFLNRYHAAQTRNPALRPRLALAA